MVEYEPNTNAPPSQHLAPLGCRVPKPEYIPRITPQERPGVCRACKVFSSRSMTWTDWSSSLPRVCGGIVAIMWRRKRYTTDVRREQVRAGTHERVLVILQLHVVRPAPGTDAVPRRAIREAAQHLCTRVHLLDDLAQQAVEYEARGVHLELRHLFRPAPAAGLIRPAPRPMHGPDIPG